MPRATGNREDRLFSLSFRHKIRQGDFLLNSLRLKVGLTVHQRGPVSLAEGAASKDACGDHVGRYGRVFASNDLYETGTFYLSRLVR
jgi:hypothetical protein